MEKMNKENIKLISLKNMLTYSFNTNFISIGAIKKKNRREAVKILKSIFGI